MKNIIFILFYETNGSLEGKCYLPFSHAEHKLLLEAFFLPKTNVLSMAFSYLKGSSWTFPMPYKQDNDIFREFYRFFLIEKIFYMVKITLSGSLMPFCGGYFFSKILGRIATREVFSHLQESRASSSIMIIEKKNTITPSDLPSSFLPRLLWLGTTSCAMGRPFGQSRSPVLAESLSASCVSPTVLAAVAVWGSNVVTL